MDNQWFVITGGPSSGKTTIIEKLKQKGYLTVPEAARTVIDEGMKDGMSVDEIRKDEKEFQAIVARRKEATEKSLDVHSITFFDRGMHDTAAYLEACEFGIEPWIKQLLNTSRYRQVFLLESLPSYTLDYARTENAIFAQKIHHLLFSAYTKYDMTPIVIKAASPEERVEYIISKIREN